MKKGRSGVGEVGQSEEEPHVVQGKSRCDGSGGAAVSNVKCCPCRSPCHK